PLPVEIALRFPHLHSSDDPIHCFTGQSSQVGPTFVGRVGPRSVDIASRALEGIGRHFFPPEDDEKQHLMLGAGLKKLRDGGKIDSRLFEWGTELADDRNWAAHPSGTKFNREDAEDVFKFTQSICEYIFVLTYEFEAFRKRKQQRRIRKTK
ncbi:MAG: DUF4145 domain-containing protein, partial [Acidobacteriota bacterium]|nr:DUF4145 domain-containing protein [Acidobacteriota bacterium]